MSLQDAVVLPIKRDGDNPHKVVNQYRKARKIATAMIDAGATADTMGECDATTVRLAIQLAGYEVTDVPSETTWALVVELVKEAKT